MRRPGVSAAGFALAAGAADDPSTAVHVAPGSDRSGRVLLACVEPLEFSPRGMELAGVALRALRETFHATPGPCANSLLAAFAAANAAVLAENRPLVTGRWPRRICVGATGVAIAGREIVVAQAPPSQAVLVQGGEVYAFPDIASWRGDYVPETPLRSAHPLGFGEEEMPRLYVSEPAPGDLILLCATAVGRALAQDDAAVLELFAGSMLTEDLEGSLDRLERLLVRQDVADAFAVLVALGRLPSRSRMWGTLPNARRVATPPQAASRVMERDSERATPRTVVTAVEDRLPPFEAVRGGLIAFAEIVGGATRRQSAPIHAARQRALAAPGAMSVRRYRESAAVPAEWRARLPRAPGLQVPARLLAVTLLLFVALGGTSVAVTRQRDREAHAAFELNAVDAALQGATENPGAAMTAVAQAEAALAAAREAGASGDPLASREAAVTHVRDDVLRIHRLDDIVRVGALPLEQGSSPVQLALSGSTLYIADGNLYELAPDSAVLIRLITHGESIGGAPAGDIRHVSIDGGELVASDGAATYRRDASGSWLRRPLPVTEIGGLRPGAPVIAWGDASYAISRDGNIVRFDQSSNEPLPKTWASIDDFAVLKQALDMTIDGRIHVLLDDGRTLTFSRGALVSTFSPFLVPALQKPAFLADAPFATGLYIVDHEAKIGENSGRIVRVDANGDAVQYLPPAPRPGDPLSSAAAVSLASADDLAIDELTGTVYWVANGEIWRGLLPLG